VDLLPLKATFAPGEEPSVEVRGVVGATRLSLYRLLGRVEEVGLEPGETVARFTPQPVGGYGIEARTSDGRATSALDVLDDPFDRPRYGFLADFAPGRELGAVVDTARRLHLNAIQLYDWMYRHASLLPPQDEFDDPLGRRLSLTTVRDATARLRTAGVATLAYAAVYAVGREAWPAWEREALARADGTPWRLGEDFLRIVDPSSETWLAHLSAELAGARAALGVDGFHLDQYGWPKRALRRDGTLVDLADAFPRLIDRLAAALPNATLLFNNVNGFPYWRTAASRQAAVYIEVWPPHDTIDDLAELVTRARLLRAGRPPILAAYLTTYRAAPARQADATAALLMATVFAHGGSHLLLGEDGRALVDPYYPRNHVLDDESLAFFRRWYDFAVRYGDLLFDPAGVDVTTSFSGGINEEVRVDGHPAGTRPEPGTVWVRVVATPAGLVVHLIDLLEEPTLLWDTPRAQPPPAAGLTLAVQEPLGGEQAFLLSPDLRDPVELRGAPVDGVRVFRLPELPRWGLIWFPAGAATGSAGRAAGSSTS
jgi:dextranase